MNKLFKYSVASVGSLMFTMTTVHATSYQAFTTLAFSNPAMLTQIQKGELIIGGTTISNRMHFTGTAAGVGGTTTSRTNYVLPYGRIAMRLSPQFVASFDVTEPYITDIQYPRNSVVRLFSTETFIRDINYSPKLSYQVTKNIALGIGLDINNLYNGQFNFVVPPFLLTNKAESWAYGFDLGAFFTISQASYLSLAYYSQIIQHVKGTSTWGPFVNTSTSAAVKLPATLIANWIQMLSKTWLISATVRYAWWDVLRFTVIKNTALPGAAPVTIPASFFNNVSTQIATRYQVNPKWAVFGSFDYEPNVQPTFTRNVGLPTYTRWYPAVGFEYVIEKGLKAKFAWAHIISKPPINMTISSGASINGHVYQNADAYDFSITYDV